ncbi:GyrI-like domain-containing protein [Aquimarina aquimarini]|uniref:GyrI-like domain-containing protein n=1 Tax=Aquimarina aquimarini TaxID=1191734 RepID=UPI000D552014|nr:GyrI-like domain-containing protein [Aquimarina aquimarini]
MIKTNLEPFWVLGISVRTTKKDNQFTKDIPALWDTFFSEGILHKIPHKLEDSIYAVYTDYKSDHTEEYTMILGCKVKNITAIPEGMKSVEVEKSTYTRFTAKGDINKGVIYDKWVSIWDTDLDRTYTTDFELYGEEAQNPSDAEVDIFVAIS